MSEPQTWFERNAKKTLLGVITVFVFAAVGVTEYILEKSLPPPTPVRRHIRLREHPPNLNSLIRLKARTLEKFQNAMVDDLDRTEYSLRTDANGFILPSKIYNDPDLSLAFIGGSTTECLVVDEDKRFPYRVGVALGEKFNKKINSYNAGFRANNSYHCLNVLLNKIIPLHPDIVVFMENINDVNVLLLSSGQSYWSGPKSRSLLVIEQDTTGRLERLSSAIRDAVFPGIAFRLGMGRSVAENDLVGERDEAAKERTPKTVPANIVEEFEANLNIFISICRARKIMPVLMTQFNRFKEHPDHKVKKTMEKVQADSGVDYATYKGLLDRFNAAIRNVARENGVLLIDLEANVPKESTYLYDIVHLNTQGSMLVADLITEAMAKSEAVQHLLEAKS